MIIAANDNWDYANDPYEGYVTITTGNGHTIDILVHESPIVPGELLIEIDGPIKGEGGTEGGPRLLIYLNDRRIIDSDHPRGAE